MWPKWLRFLLGAWVARDSNTRGGISLFWILVVFFLGPLLVPVYMAIRPLLPGELRRGTMLSNILWNFETLLSSLLALAAMAVSVENFLESESSDLPVVKRAEIKAGTLFGILATITVYVISRVAIFCFRGQCEDAS